MTGLVAARFIKIVKHTQEICSLDLFNVLILLLNKCARSSLNRITHSDLLIEPQLYKNCLNSCLKNVQN